MSSTNPCPGAGVRVPRPWPSTSRLIRPAPQVNSASSAGVGAAGHRLFRSHYQGSCGHADLLGGQAQNDTHRSQRTNRPQRDIRRNPANGVDRAAYSSAGRASCSGLGAVPCAPHREFLGTAPRSIGDTPQENPPDANPPPPAHSPHRILGGIAETRSHAGGFLRGADAAGRQPPRAFGQVHRGPSLVGKRHVLRCPKWRRDRVKLVAQDLAVFCAPKAGRTIPVEPSPSNRRREPLPPRPWLTWSATLSVHPR